MSEIVVSDAGKKRKNDEDDTNEEKKPRLFSMQISESALISYQKQSQELSKSIVKTNFYQEKNKNLLASYDAIHEARVKKDFMYMFLSNANPEEKKSYLKTLVDLIEKNYSDKVIKGGLDEDSIKIFRHVITLGDQIYQDALWFFCMYVVSALRDWMIVGDIVNKQNPPRIGNKKQLEWFLRSNGFGNLSESLLNGDFNPEFSLEQFVITARGEFGMSVGIADIRE
jgi:hypothetical protein